ncbi:hypothetical protein P873_11040 [Arenimonas composti TR7-09 = DSM 18010]|uniref:Uncharacterized protein n=1 Tax=Arenimonas composti TR7-09 = DSM 18010 TaxID=1121013 RepID=A0A091BYS5_9GAMM|nr:hypothetical protein P873_11040 [Arenimonas composti TR7-09 = DSM 18010]
MTAREERQRLVTLIEEAHTGGARLAVACREAGVTLRTLQRWRDPEAGIRADGRPDAVHPKPVNALSEQERADIVEVANTPQYAALPPAQIVPRLADAGRYLASESSFHRVHVRLDKPTTAAGPRHRRTVASRPRM